MKRIILILLCLLLCAFALVGCSDKDGANGGAEGGGSQKGKRYTTMTGVEFVDDGEGRYIGKAEFSSDEILNIFNSGKWSDDVEANILYDYKFTFDGKAVLYNSETGVATEGGAGITLSEKNMAKIKSIMLETFSHKTSADEVLDSSISVISGSQKIAPKQFKIWSEVKNTISGDLEQTVTIDYDGCSEVYSYTEEQLAEIPAIKLDGEITLELSDSSTFESVVLMRVGREGAEDSRTSLKELAELDSGEYYIYIRTTARNEYSAGAFQNVFKLIIE